MMGAEAGARQLPQNHELRRSGSCEEAAVPGPGRSRLPCPQFDSRPIATSDFRRCDLVNACYSSHRVCGHLSQQHKYLMKK